MRKLINVVITSSIMIVVVMILRKLFGSRVKSGVICVLWALVRMLCVCIYRFNPLVWLATHFYKEDCELFCDEAVVRNCSVSERQKYGEVLLNAATGRTGRLSDMYILSGASSGYRELKKRIERIADNKKTYKSAAFILVIIVVAVTVLAFGGASVKGSKPRSVACFTAGS